jgi:hypothetical protein
MVVAYRCRQATRHYRSLHTDPSVSAPVASRWIHEIKHHGYRLIARKRDRQDALVHPQRLRLVRALSPISEAVAALAPASAVEGSGTCILIKGNLESANLLESWFSAEADDVSTLQIGAAHVAFEVCDPLGPCKFEISRLNSSLHAIVVYVPSWSSPSTTQHSLAGESYPLPAPDLHWLESASLSTRNKAVSPRDDRSRHPVEYFLRHHAEILGLVPKIFEPVQSEPRGKHRVCIRSFSKTSRRRSIARPDGSVAGDHCCGSFPRKSCKRPRSRKGERQTSRFLQRP